MKWQSLKWWWAWPIVWLFPLGCQPITLDKELVRAEVKAAVASPEITACLSNQFQGTIDSKVELAVNRKVDQTAGDLSTKTGTWGFTVGNVTIDGGVAIIVVALAVTFGDDLLKYLMRKARKRRKQGQGAVLRPK